jgi:4-methylaminobutanoate oxidase (formaldehyde-forming)
MDAARVSETEVVVVGGGVIGCSVAYHLAAAGCRDVLLVERNDLGSGTTSSSAGLIGQVRASAVLVRLIRRTLDAVRRLEAELGEPVGFRPVGSLVVASTPEREREIEAQLALVRAEGVDAGRLDGAAARRLVPGLDTRGARAIGHVPTDGYVDAYQLATAYARAAKARGAAVWTGTGVTGVSVRDRRVVGVATDRGEVGCRWVVDAAGPWAGLLATLAGVDLPMAPVRSHFWITAPHPAVGRDQPVVRLPDARAYTRPEVGGLLVGVHEPESRAYDARELGTGFSMRQVDRDWDVVLDRLVAIQPYFPFLEEAGMVDGIAGLTTYTPDGRYLLGPVPGLDGFLVAGGCCGLGVAGSGGIGSVIAELVTEGASSLDLAPFRVDRFGPVDPYSPAFRHRCAQARSLKNVLAEPDRPG